MTPAGLRVLAGLALLFVAGDVLVRGATALALLARIPVTVVALTVVAMGTSMPELAVSLDAATRGSTDIAFGNVVGSNIFNVGAILGIAALLAPIPVTQQTLRIEYPIMVIVSGIALVLSRDGAIDRVEGAMLEVLLVTFIGYMVYLARRGVPPGEAQSLGREARRAGHLEHGPAVAWSANVALVTGGIVGLVIGAHLAVDGAVTLADGLGVSQRVIGLTVVAMGTSLPELATSVMAARQGESEIALGNIVGSNIFNLLAILGITATLVPIPVHRQSIAVDNWVMLGFSAALLPMMLRGRTVNRWNGTLLLAAFLGYMAWVVVTR